MGEEKELQTAVLVVTGDRKGNIREAYFVTEGPVSQITDNPPLDIDWEKTVVDRKGRERTIVKYKLPRKGVSLRSIVCPTLDFGENWGFSFKIIRKEGQRAKEIQLPEEVFANHYMLALAQ